MKIDLENYARVWKCPECGKWKVEKLSHSDYDEYVCMNIYCDFRQKEEEQ